MKPNRTEKDRMKSIQELGRISELYPRMQMMCVALRITVTTALREAIYLWIVANKKYDNEISHKEDRMAERFKMLCLLKQEQMVNEIHNAIEMWLDKYKKGA